MTNHTCRLMTPILCSILGPDYANLGRLNNNNNIRQTQKNKLKEIKINYFGNVTAPCQAIQVLPQKHNRKPTSKDAIDVLYHFQVQWLARLWISRSSPQLQPKEIALIHQKGIELQHAKTTVETGNYKIIF